MISPQDTRCWAFSYDEFERIIADEVKCEHVVDYGSGGEIWVKMRDEEYPAIEIVHVAIPEIPDNATCFYPEFGYIYTRKDADVVIIDGIQK